MPQGKGTYGSQVGRPSKKSSTFYKMKGFSGFGNDSPIEKESDYNRRIRERTKI